MRVAVINFGFLFTFYIVLFVLSFVVVGLYTQCYTVLDEPPIITRPPPYLLYT